MLKVVAALLLSELVEDAAEELPKLVHGSLRAITQELLQFRERQLDGIQVGRVRRQVTQLRAGGLDRFANTGDLVAGKIVHHHDVTRFEHGSQMLFHPSAK